MIEYIWYALCSCSFGEFGGLLRGSFSRAFSGMTEAWNFVAHGCHLEVNLKADKFNPLTIPVKTLSFEWAQLP